MTSHRPTSDDEREQARQRAHEWYHQPGNAERQRARVQARRADPAEAEKLRAAQREYTRKWRERNPGGAAKASRMHRYRRKYGLTEEQIAALESHSGICDACGIDQARDVDHCHDGNGFRGYLCHACNTAAGLLMNDPARAQSLAEYLARVRPSP